MKTHVLIALAIVTMATTPVFAQTSRSHAPKSQSAYASANAFAYAKSGVRAVNRSHDVFDTRGRFVGSDPDPNVRNMLAHDSGVND